MIFSELEYRKKKTENFSAAS